LLSSPSAFYKSIRSPIFFIGFRFRPLGFKFYLQISPSLQILHFSPSNSSNLQILFTRALGIFQISPQTFPNSYFSTQKFFPSYIFNRNYESGDSCAKILRITSYFSSCYSYSYDYYICLIVCLSVKRIFPKPMHEDSKIKYMRISRPIIRGLRSCLFKATRQGSLNILHLYTYACVNECTPIIGLTRLAYPSLKP
jgi:hypothetical protein